MIPYLKYHEANKELTAQWKYGVGYNDLSAKGQMEIDDLIADDWLMLRGKLKPAFLQK